MASEAITLADDRREAGYRLLELTDRVGFDALGAGWGFTEATQSWRFYLFTELTDTKGPLWVWERLLKAFSKLDLPPGITPLDIRVASPDEWLYRLIPVKIGDTPEGVGAVSQTDDISSWGYGIDRLWLLRSKPEQALRKSVARRFDLKVRQLMAA